MRSTPEGYPPGREHLFKARAIAQSAGVSGQVDSSSSHTRYPIMCNGRGGRYTGTVYCQGPADTGIWTRFSALI